MDNEEHHPHVVDDGLSYEELAPGCSCLFAVVSFFIFIGCIAFGISFYKFTNEDIFKPEKCTEISYLRQNYYQCGEVRRLLKIEMAKEAKKAEARRKFVDDSIARYQVLHDSLFEAMRVKDSIDAALANQKKIKVDFIAFIDDGVTSREVTVNSLNDSLSLNDITLLGEAFGKMAYTAVKDRQFEIDNNKEYYTKRIKNEDQ